MLIHSDSAPEFMSEAMEALAKTLEMKLTTVMENSANTNNSGLVEVIWRF